MSIDSSSLLLIMAGSKALSSSSKADNNSKSGNPLFGSGNSEESDSQNLSDDIISSLRNFIKEIKNFFSKDNSKNKSQSDCGSGGSGSSNNAGGCCGSGGCGNSSNQQGQQPLQNNSGALTGFKLDTPQGTLTGFSLGSGGLNNQMNPLGSLGGLNGGLGLGSLNGGLGLGLNGGLGLGSLNGGLGLGLNGGLGLFPLNGGLSYGLGTGFNLGLGGLGGGIYPQAYPSLSILSFNP